MAQIVVNVFKDQVTTYPEGCPRAVDIKSQVIGPDANVYLEMFPADRCAGAEMPVPTTLLKIKQGNNFLWIDETEASWNAKVNGVNCCPGGPSWEVEP